MQEGALIHPYEWLTWRLPLHFSNVSFISHPEVLGFLLIQLRLMRNSGRLRFPICVALGKGKPALSAEEVDGWLPLLSVISLPHLTGEMLADVVRRKGATAGSLDGWGWRDMKVLPVVAWFDGPARVRSMVEEIGVWPEGLLDACIAMIPKADGDATPLGQSVECSPGCVPYLGFCPYGAAGGVVSVMGS